MSLTACRECGQEVSTEAATCPHCGCINPVPKKTGCGGVFIIIFVLALIAAVAKAVIDGHIRF